MYLSAYVPPLSAPLYVDLLKAWYSQIEWWQRHGGALESFCVEKRTYFVVACCVPDETYGEWRRKLARGESLLGSR